MVVRILAVEIYFIIWCLEFEISLQVCHMSFIKNEKVKILIFYTALTIVLTWPAAWHFFSSVPSLGSDTMQVIGVAGERMNFLKEQGLLAGTFELMKRSEFNIVTLYAYFFLVFGRIVGYNLLFFASFIFSGLGAYLLAYYFIHPALKTNQATKGDLEKNGFWHGASKPASFIAGIIFAFSPFHIHNSLSTNVGTMHQEWLPFFVLYLFRFFDDLKFKNFVLAGVFLGLIAFTEHQLLAFTFIFVLFFLAYKIFSQPRIFLRKKFWLYAIVSAVIFSVAFFFMFRSLFEIASSENNYLNPGFKAAVKYSNDSLAIFIPPPFHSFWPNAFSKLRETFERRIDSSFSVYAGFSVLALSVLAIGGIRSLRRDRIPPKGIWFWLAVAVGFYVLSLGPHLHYKGVLDPPVKMPYLLFYNYFPFFENIRTVGRLFIFSILAFSLLAAWGSAYVISKIKNQKSKIDEKDPQNNNDHEQPGIFSGLSKKQKIAYSAIALIVILEYLAIPVKTNSLLHSPFYEKLGKDNEDYNILEIPGSTDYDFASRDLVWKSIHRKNTVNGYDFARVIEDRYTFQRGTPIIRTLLYDIPGGSNGSDRDIMKDSYYKISNEILGYYNIRYIILDREGLKGKAEEAKENRYYSARGYVQNVIRCENEYEDEYLFACEVERSPERKHMFVAMDYSNKHWVGKDKGKDGIRRQAENGAGVKIVNMAPYSQDGKFAFKVKLYKPLGIKVFFNGEQVYEKYLTNISEKSTIEVGVKNIKPGENNVIFGVFAADGKEIVSEEKTDVATIYSVEIK